MIKNCREIIFPAVFLFFNRNIYTDYGSGFRNRGASDVNTDGVACVDDSWIYGRSDSGGSGGGIVFVHGGNSKHNLVFVCKVQECTGFPEDCAAAWPAADDSGCDLLGKSDKNHSLHSPFWRDRAYEFVSV